MPNTQTLVTALAIAAAAMLCALPAQAQRVFVSGSGLDSNPCTYAAPCRTFQQAYNTLTSTGEIDVPAGYGALTINSHGVAIYGNGWGAITQTTSGAAAITVSAATTAHINLNGLVLTGEGTGGSGVVVNSAGSVVIFNCFIGAFTDGINFAPTNSPTVLLVDNTLLGLNTSGIIINPQNSNANTPVTLDHVTLNHNVTGVTVDSGNVTISNSNLSGNGTGLDDVGPTVWLAKNVVTNNTTGVLVGGSGLVNSFGDNYIKGNSTTNISGSLTPTSTD